MRTLIEDFFATNYRGFVWGESPSIAAVFDQKKGDLLDRKKIEDFLGTPGKVVPTRSLSWGIILSGNSALTRKAGIAMNQLKKELHYVSDDMTRRQIEPIANSDFIGELKTGRFTDDKDSVAGFKFKLEDRINVEPVIRKVDALYGRSFERKRVEQRSACSL